MQVSRLEARVKAVNKANKYATEIFPILQEFFRQYVGQKVEKADGQLLAKIVDKMPKFANGQGLRVYKYSSNYSLAWTVVASENCEFNGAYHSCVYHETTVYVGDLEESILKGLSNPFSAKYDYSVDEVVKLREKYQIAKKAASEAESALWPFGEYDR